MTKYILWIYAILIVVVDRLSKNYAEAFLWMERVSIVSDVLSFSLAYNSGVAFSLPLSGVLQVILTILIIIGLCIYAVRFDPTRSLTLSKYGYASVFAWAVTNAFDRIAMGKVVDFISLKYFAIFNVADIFITFGAILLIISHIRHEYTSRK